MVFGPDARIAEARGVGEDYLLERRLLRRLSTGDLIDADWSRLSFPPLWHYDVLRALDYLRAAGLDRDERMARADHLIRGRVEHDVAVGRLEGQHLGTAEAPDVAVLDERARQHGSLAA